MPRKNCNASGKTGVRGKSRTSNSNDEDIRLKQIKKLNKLMCGKRMVSNS